MLNNNVVQSKVFPYSCLIADNNETLNIGIRNWAQRHTAYMLKYCEIGGLLTALIKIQFFLDVMSCQPVYSDIGKERVSFETQVTCDRHSISSQKINLCVI
jgi:hypothetical protein